MCFFRTTEHQSARTARQVDTKNFITFDRPLVNSLVLHATNIFDIFPIPGRDLLLLCGQKIPQVSLRGCGITSLPLVSEYMTVSYTKKYMNSLSFNYHLWFQLKSRVNGVQKPDDGPVPVGGAPQAKASNKSGGNKKKGYYMSIHHLSRPSFAYYLQ